MEVTGNTDKPKLSHSHTQTQTQIQTPLLQGRLGHFIITITQRPAIHFPQNPFTALVIGFCYSCRHGVDIMKGSAASFADMDVFTAPETLYQGIVCHVQCINTLLKVNDETKVMNQVKGRQSCLRLRLRSKIWATVMMWLWVCCLKMCHDERWNLYGL